MCSVQIQGQHHISCLRAQLFHAPKLRIPGFAHKECPFKARRALGQLIPIPSLWAGNSNAALQDVWDKEARRLLWGEQKDESQKAPNQRANAEWDPSGAQGCLGYSVEPGGASLH